MFIPEKVGDKRQGVLSTSKSRGTCPSVHPRIYVHEVTRAKKSHASLTKYIHTIDRMQLIQHIKYRSNNGTSTFNAHCTSLYNILTVMVLSTRLPFNRRRTTSKCMYLVTLVRRFCCCDLDLDPTTLMYELYLDNLKTCSSTTINFLRQVFKKYEQHRHTDKRTDRRDRTHYSRISAR